MPILRALENDSYSAGDADISITGLVNPAHQRKLINLHWDELVEDASDRIWALFGQAVHGILERAASSEYVVEKRLYWVSGGWKISGQVDVYTPATETIQDYKTTSSWSVLDESYKPDWEYQLNGYGWLSRGNGLPVQQLEVIAFLRDWSKTQRLKSGKGYPRLAVARRDIPLWTLEEQDEYIADRVLLHKMTTPPLCTPEERWDKPTKWAVRKPGAAKATRVYGTNEEALLHIERDASVEMEVRPGESVRCLHYCPVRAHCEYGQTL